MQDMQTDFTLNNSSKTPALGMGTWKIPNESAEAAVTHALVEAGYRHIDCAAIYGNEKGIGQAFGKVFGDGKIKREDVFVTSKLWNTEHHPDNVEKACRQTLKDLQLDYLDLYLIHWGIAFQPGGDSEPLDKDGWAITEPVSIRETWEAMERLVEKGLVKSIGVSNFTVTMLLDLLTYAKTKPAVNQIELHPYLPQTALVDFCKRYDILPVAYCPLVRGGLDDFKQGVVGELAKKYGKTPAQILLNWAVARGTGAIPKTVTPERMTENLAIFDFELTLAEQEQVAALDKNERVCNPAVWWRVPYFA